MINPNTLNLKRHCKECDCIDSKQCKEYTCECYICGCITLVKTTDPDFFNDKEGRVFHVHKEDLSFYVSDKPITSKVDWSKLDKVEVEALNENPAIFDNITEDEQTELIKKHNELINEILFSYPLPPEGGYYGVSPLESINRIAVPLSRFEQFKHYIKRKIFRKKTKNLFRYNYLGGLLELD